METPIDNIRLRELRSLQWYEPKQILINLRYVETHLLTENMDERVRRLRTNELKELREGREAAIFAYGLETEVIKNQVLVANTERSDYDFVMRWIKDENEYFYPVQLKELPPDDLNAQVSLEGIYNKLEKYSGTDDLAVAIHVNRRMRLKWGPWERQKKPRIRELWLFGTNSPDPSKWFICGDILKKPRFYEFRYPEGQPTLPNPSLQPTRNTGG
jgi:hypothetical protein